MPWFALATYRAGDRRRAAVVLGGMLYDLEAVCRVARREPGRARLARMSVDELVRDWPRVDRALARVVEEVAPKVASGALRAVARGLSRLLAPLAPRRLFCAAANYVEHAQEMGSVLAQKSQSKPYMFLKLPECVVGPGRAVLIPPESAQVDWEVELGVVIGRRGRRIAARRALDHVAGYTVVNDVSARDLNVRSDYPFKFDWFAGKCFDTFAPLGPWLVPKAFVPDPQQLHLKLRVNGEVMQDADTGEMIFDVREQIEYLSGVLTLEPGDVIATGTPTGVGMARGIFLKPGDTMTAEIEKIGALVTPVGAERRR